MSFVGTAASLGLEWWLFSFVPSTHTSWCHVTLATMSLKCCADSSGEDFVYFPEATLPFPQYKETTPMALRAPSCCEEGSGKRLLLF